MLRRMKVWAKKNDTDTCRTPLTVDELSEVMIESHKNSSRIDCDGYDFLIHGTRLDVSHRNDIMPGVFCCDDCLPWHIFVGKKFRHRLGRDGINPLLLN